MKPTVSFHTLGCKLNFAETSAIGMQLKEAGFEKIDFDRGADVVVINTCSVTENADRECRTIVRRALQRNPESFVAVIGCYAQLKPEAIAGMEGVDLVLGAKEKFNLAAFLGSYTKKQKAEIRSCTVGEVTEFHSAYSFGDRTRAFLKVQDGCNYPCTYCTIPFARGRSRSASIQKVVRDANALQQKQVSEIVLTGVNIGDYGHYEIHSGKHSGDFYSLIRALENETHVYRYRISSIEPNLLRNEIIDFVAASKRFSPHFHMPLQSGSDKILRSMKRRYRSDLYSDRVHYIKNKLPQACIGVDVIVGFPGETEKEFLETYDFLKNLPVSYLHVFTYSERDNTEAATMPGSVDVAERKRRNHMLRILSEKKKQEFYRQHTGRQFYVLFEEAEQEGRMLGYTENYIRVSMAYRSELINKPVEVCLSEYDGGSCVQAELIEVPLYS